jgi:hypothetical protein
MTIARVKRFRALLCGAILLLLGVGCSLVDRAGQDLQTAGSNISHSADWVRNKLGGGDARPPPVTAGHSPGVANAPEGSSAPPPNGGSDLPCGWANIKPNC